MGTIEAPVERQIHDQVSVSEAMRPSIQELSRARRQLHVKAVVIGGLAVGLAAQDTRIVHLRCRVGV